MHNLHLLLYFHSSALYIGDGIIVMIPSHYDFYIHSVFIFKGHSCHVELEFCYNLDEWCSRY